MRSRLCSTFGLGTGLWLAAGLQGCQNPPASAEKEGAQPASEPAAPASRPDSPSPQPAAPEAVQEPERADTPPTQEPTKPAGAKVTAACAGMCEHTVSLGCGTLEACMVNCASMLQGDLCPDRMQAFLECALSKPSSDWECTPDEVAAVKDGVCDKEQKAFVTCAQQAAARE